MSDGNTEVVTETTEVVTDTEVEEDYTPSTGVEYVDDDSVVQVEGEESPLNYLSDTTEYEEWFSDTEEVDAVTVVGTTENAQSTSKSHVGLFCGIVIGLVVAVLVVILIIKKVK